MEFIFSALNLVRTIIVVLLGVVGSSWAWGYLEPDPSYGFLNNRNTVWGHVYARGVLKDENNNSVYVEFDNTGEEVSEIGPATGDLAEVTVMAGATWRQYQNQYRAIVAEWKKSHSDDHSLQLLSIEGYRQAKAELKTVNNEPVQNQVTALSRGNTRSVLVKPASLIYSKITPWVVQEFPVDLTQNNDLAESVESLLLNDNGQYIYESNNRIGFRSAFYTINEEAYTGDRLYSTSLLLSGDASIEQTSLKLTNPIPYLPMEAPMGYRGGAITDQNGEYKMVVMGTPCPLFYYQTNVFIDAKIPTTHMNPEVRRPYWKYLGRYFPFACNGVAVVGIPANSTSPVRLDFQVDVNIITGDIVIPGVTLSDALKYEMAMPSEFENIVQTRYDFDLDGSFDRSVCGTLTGSNLFKPSDASDKCDKASVQGVYLSSGRANPDLCGSGSEEELQADGCQPDITRVIDQQGTGVDNRTLRVTKMDRASFQDTDVFIIRESTGDLVMMRQGLKDSESAAVYMGEDPSGGTPEYDHILGGTGEIVSSNQRLLTRYRMLMRGGDDVSYTSSAGAVNVANFSEWQAKGNIAPQFHSIDSDLVKPGETLLIYAINRVTGYMGYQRVLTDQLAGATLDTLVEPIRMYPPNLKVWAERKYDIEAGNNKGETAEYLVGYEGAGEADDTIIQMYTDWTAPDGTAIPTALQDYGYTGRIAYSTSDSSLSDASQVGTARFKIEPGKHAQVIRLPGNDTAANQHFYVQAFGVPYGEFQDFALGQQSRGLDGSDLQGVEENAWRPKFFVPVKVPVFDESSSLIQEQAFGLYKKSLREKQASGEQTDVDPDTLDDPDPIYNWIARPEYQFSVYDLDVTAINVNETDDEGNVETVNLLEDEAVALGSESTLEILYKLYGSDNDGLQRYQSENQTLILNVGGNETEVSVTENGSLEFSDPTALMGLTGDDLLSVSLYTNTDSANILWQWAYDFLQVESILLGYENQTDEIWYVTADDPTVKLRASIPGYAYKPQSAKEPVTVEWIVEGSGSMASSSQTDSETAIFDNILTMPTTKGVSASVSVSSRDSDSEAKWKTVQVLAGEPKHITLSQTGQAIAFQQKEVTIDVVATDQYGNLVEDGTPLSINFDSSLLEVSSELQTTNGVATLVLTGGEYAADSAKVEICVVDVCQETIVSIGGLDVELIATHSQLNPLQSTQLTAMVTANGSPVSGVPVLFTSTAGGLAENIVTTNGNGEAVVTFRAGLNPDSGNWSAQVGYAGGTTMDYEVTMPSGGGMNAKNTVLVADQTSDGEITFDYYGTSISSPYKTSAPVDINISEATNVVLGDMADPNLEPLMAFSLAGFDDDGEFTDEHLLVKGMPQDVTLVRDHPLGAGQSASLFASSRIVIDKDPSTHLIDNLGMRIDAKILSAGDIISRTDSFQRLKYTEGGKLEYSVQTTDGMFSVMSEAVTSGEWHSIATRIQHGRLELYVDGKVTQTAISGDLIYDNKEHIELGGAQSVLRGFRVYNWASQPLVAFDGGSTSVSVNKGEKTLTIKSLGNLGKVRAGSQLKTLRLAITAGGKKNYVSLMSSYGYQELSKRYRSTIGASTASTVQYQPNPLSGLVPTAHAWGWDSIWDGVVDAVGYLIPYEDFITIGEQLVYLAQRDWKNFDAATLAFASIGAATVLPIAKPLKPLLGPAKKMVDFMKRFPASKYFAGVIGTAVKKALSGDTKKLGDLVPFIEVAVILYEEPKVFEFILDTIESEDDLWVWIEYLAELGKETSEEDIVFNEANIRSEILSNPLPSVVADSHALSSVQRQLLAGVIKEIKKLRLVIPAGQRSQITKSLGVVLKNDDLRKILLSGGASVQLLLRIGANRIRSFIRYSKDWRINRWLVLFCLLYLAEEYDSERLNLRSDSQYKSLLSNVFSKGASNRNGAVYQVVMTAYYHALNQISGSLPNNVPDGGGYQIVGIDARRGANYIKNSALTGSFKYNRQVDIVLKDSEGKETWVELKSYSASSISSAVSTNSGVLVRKNSNRREFFHDYRLNKDFITSNSVYKKEILGKDNSGKPISPNENLVWYYQDFGSSTASAQNRGPSLQDIVKTRNKLCGLPKGFERESLQYNFAPNTSVVGPMTTKQADCSRKVSDWVKMGNTRSYFSRVLEAVGSDLADQIRIQFAAIP